MVSLPAPTRPSFRLTLDRSSAELRLLEPWRTELGRFETCELVLAQLGGPLRLDGSVSRFRSRRSALKKAVFALDMQGLLRQARSLGVRLEIVPDASRGVNHVAVLVDDAHGALALDACLGTEGPDVLAHLSDVRAVLSAPENPWSRAHAVFERLGWRFDASVGAYRLRRPLRALFIRLLVPHGYRIPDERALSMGLRADDEGAPTLVLGDDLPSVPLADELSHLSLSWQELVENDLGSARATLSAAARRCRTPAARALIDEFSAGVLAEMQEPLPAVSEALLRATEGAAWARALRFRIAVEGRESAEALRLAEEIIEKDPCSGLGATALLGAASLREPAEAHRLIVRAAADRPDDVRLQLEHVRAAEAAGAVEALASFVARPPLSDPTDAHRVVGEAAAALVRLGRPEAAHAAWAKLLLDHPNDPRVLEGAAAVAGHDLLRAVDLLDRAARAHERFHAPAEAARVFCRAADLLEGAERLAGAEHRLELALALDPSSASAKTRLEALRRGRPQGH